MAEVLFVPDKEKESNVQFLLNLLVRWPFLLFVRFVLSYHYKVREHNKAALQGLRGGFVLPSHSALFDPVVTQSRIWPATKARPVVYKGQYDGLKPLMKLVRAFPLSSTSDGAGSWQHRKIRLQLQAVKDAQKSGDNILIYPSGQIKRTIKEELGGKSGVYEMVQENPEAPIVLVRIRGLWGSATSRYFTGGVSSPSWGHVFALIKHNLGAYLKFWQKTVIDIDYERVNVPVEAMASVQTFNAWLEDWYNAKPDHLIPGRDDPSFAVDGFEYAADTTEGEVTIDPAIRAQVEKLVRDKVGVPAERELHLADRFEADLGADSLTRTAMIVLIEETFAVSIAQDAPFTTLQDAVVAAQGGAADNSAGEMEAQAPAGWVESNRPAPAWNEAAESLPHAFILTRDRVGGEAIACGGTNAAGEDEMRTYNEKLARAMLIANHVKEMPGEAIGMMLPATVAADILIMAIMLAGKKVVPFNWTIGAGPLAQTIETSGVQRILSADAFLDRLDVELTHETMDMIVPLEHMLAGSLMQKAGTALRLLQARKRAKWSADRIRSIYPYSMNRDDTAVILFTSGSESAPKGVPLSHGNVMACVKGALSAMGGVPEDVMFAFLPPFHSFGFSMEVMLAAATGVKIVYEPDPKRFRRLAKTVKKWHVTLVPGTPDFVAGILDAAEDSSEFSTVRAFMTGASPAPQVLKDRVAELGADFFEGYGITETAPLVSMTRPGVKPVGVGQPIDGVEVMIVSIEPDENGQYREMPTGEVGTIFVTGATVFGGYMGNIKHPFEDVGGVRYYNTGDLGFKDDDGNITISGRLKRFIKPFGEMVSIPAIENILLSHWPSTQDGPIVAVEGEDDAEGGPGYICLYTSDPSVTIEEAQKVLQDNGMSKGFTWPRYLFKVDEIPLLGTGKPNYRALPKPSEVAAQQAALA